MSLDTFYIHRISEHFFKPKLKLIFLWKVKRNLLSIWRDSNTFFSQPFSSNKWHRWQKRVAVASLTLREGEKTRWGLPLGKPPNPALTVDLTEHYTIKSLKIRWPANFMHFKKVNRRISLKLRCVRSGSFWTEFHSKANHHVYMHSFPAGALLSPDRPFHSFKASRSGDRRNLFS